MEYKYKLGNLKDTKTGTVEAGSREEAYDLIKKDGWFVLELGEKNNSILNFDFGKSESMGSFERINLTDHMASMIGAGTPIHDALDAYADDGEKRSQIITRIVNDIEKGKQLSQSLLNFPKIFSPLYIALVKAGEISGNLDETLAYLANELRREHEFKARVKSAMFYPMLVMIVSIAVVILVVSTVIPKVADITKSLGVEMPFFTRLVVNASDFLVNNYLLIVLSVILFITALIIFLKQKEVQEKLKVRFLKMPVVGSIMRKYTLARLLRIIGSCVKYGIPLPQAFDSAKQVVNNRLYEQAVERINKKITKGETLAQSLTQEDKTLFPGIIARSIRGAEKTGAIDSTLFRLSTQYEIEVDRELKRATELLEPVMVVVLGVIVLGIAVSVIAPIYQLTSNL